MRGSSANTKRTLGGGIGLAGLALWLVVASPVWGEEAPALAAGTRALYRGDYDRAASLAENYLKAHPQASAGQILLARAHIAKGQYDLALKELQRVLRTDARNLDALYYLGRLSGILSQMEFQRLFAQAPDSARVHQLLAESYEAQNNIAKAEEEYQAALKANPQSVEILDALGDLKRHQFEFDEAITYYARAAEIQPRDYSSAYGLGATYLYRQEVARAIDYFRGALAIDPDSAAARLALGDALLRAGQPEPAVKELKAALTLEPEMRQAYTLLARAYQKLGNSEEANAALKRSEELIQKEIESRERLLGPGGTLSFSPPPSPSDQPAPAPVH